MCFNVGKIDRVLRVVVGLGVIAYGVVTQNYIIAVVGVVPIVTAGIGLCPLYSVLKINTGCKKD